MKKNNKGFTAIEIIVCFQILVVVAIGISWCVNFYKLTQCDFAAPYKGEVIHAVGIFPPAALVTVWFDAK